RRRGGGAGRSVAVAGRRQAHRYPSPVGAVGRRAGCGSGGRPGRVRHRRRIGVARTGCGGEASAGGLRLVWWAVEVVVGADAGEEAVGDEDALDAVVVAPGGGDVVVAGRGEERSGAHVGSPAVTRGGGGLVGSLRRPRRDWVLVWCWSGDHVGVSFRCGVPRERSSRLVSSIRLNTSECGPRFKRGGRLWGRLDQIGR